MKKQVITALAAALCALGAAFPVAATSEVPPPEAREVTARVFFENKSSRDLWVEVTVNEDLRKAVQGGFIPYLEKFCVDTGDRIRTELFVIGVSNTPFCTPNKLITSIRFYDLATGEEIGRLEVGENTFQDAPDLAPYGDGLYYRMTIDDDLLGGLQ